MSTQEKIEQLYYRTDGNKRLGIPKFTGSDGVAIIPASVINSKEHRQI
jgi:hypothetical protein